MVPVITYRDERKLFAVIATVLAAAIISLIQIQSARSGKPGPIAAALTSAAVFAQSAVAAATDAARSVGGEVASLPQLTARNHRLETENRDLVRQNLRLQEAAARAPEDTAVAQLARSEPADIEATVVGYDPENQTRLVTVDRGLQAGVALEDGVVSPDGIVGRVIEVDPLSSKVLLAIDTGSKIPAVVQRGRWWGIATGTNSRIQLRFISQDAKIKTGDVVVTGEGRSFRAGLAVGRVAQVSNPEGALYQTALVEPAVPFGRLHRVLIVPQ